MQFLPAEGGEEVDGGEGGEEDEEDDDDESDDDVHVTIGDIKTAPQYSNLNIKRGAQLSSGLEKLNKVSNSRPYTLFPPPLLTVQLSLKIVHYVQLQKEYTRMKQSIIRTQANRRYEEVCLGERSSLFFPSPTYLLFPFLPPLCILYSYICNICCNIQVTLEKIRVKSHI